MIIMASDNPTTLQTANGCNPLRYGMIRGSRAISRERYVATMGAANVRARVGLLNNATYLGRHGRVGYVVSATRFAAEALAADGYDCEPLGAVNGAYQWHVVRRFGVDECAFGA